MVHQNCNLSGKGKDNKKSSFQLAKLFCCFDDGSRGFLSKRAR